MQTTRHHHSLPAYGLGRPLTVALSISLTLLATLVPATAQADDLRASRPLTPLCRVEHWTLAPSEILVDPPHPMLLLTSPDSRRYALLNLPACRVEELSIGPQDTSEQYPDELLHYAARSGTRVTSCRNASAICVARPGGPTLTLHPSEPGAGRRAYALSGNGRWLAFSEVDPDDAPHFVEGRGTLQRTHVRIRPIHGGPDHILTPIGEFAELSSPGDLRALAISDDGQAVLVAVNKGLEAAGYRVGALRLGPAGTVALEPPILGATSVHRVHALDPISDQAGQQAGDQAAREGERRRPPGLLWIGGRPGQASMANEASHAGWVIEGRTGHWALSTLTRSRLGWIRSAQISPDLRFLAVSIGFGLRGIPQKSVAELISLPELRSVARFQAASGGLGIDISLTRGFVAISRFDPAAKAHGVEVMRLPDADSSRGRR